MDRRELIRFLVGGLAAAVVPGVAACDRRDYYLTPAPKPFPRYWHEYYYYPHAGIYFHLHRGDYYYYSHGAWRSTRVLPGHIYLDPRYRRKLFIRDSRPYDRIREHRRLYPSLPAQRRDRVQHRDGTHHLNRDRREREHNRKQHERYRKRR